MTATALTPLTDRHVRITVDEIDRATVVRFAAELAAPGPGPYCLVVDLADVAFIDASGVQALVDAAQAMTRAGGQIALRHPRAAVRRILDLLDLSELLPTR